MKRKKVTKKVEPNKKTSEEKRASDSTDGRVFDVTRPGKSMPSASSRPVIVTHKPNVSDPMVSPKNPEKSDSNEATDDDGPSAGEGADMVMAAPKKGRIEPLHTDIVPDSEQSEVPEEKEARAESEDSETPEEEKTSSQATPEEDEAAKPSTEDESSDEISDMAAEATTKKQAQNEAAKKEADAAQKQAEVDALINNKQFFVPINAVQKRRSMKLVVVSLVVIFVAVAGFIVALDAELLDIGLEPPTDFIQR